MNKRTRMFGFAAAAALLAAALFVSGDDSPRPLVRRDLIRTASPEFPKIKRDIFSTIPFAPAEGDFAAGPGGLGESGVGRPGGTRDKAEPALPPPAEVRYVGFIRNLPRRTVTAIVLIDEKAWAVSEGEVFAFGWSALKVSDEEIELLNPLGEKLVFLFEGECP